MLVAVYRNLRKNCWSVMAMEGPKKGRVIHHMQQLDLEDCIFKVSQAGNARVRREKRKNVHAKIIGRLVGEVLPWSNTLTTPSGYAVDVVYDPYRMTEFHTHHGNPIHKASKVYFRFSTVYADLFKE